MNAISWIIVIASIILFYMAVASKTGFRILVNANKEPRFTVPEGLKGFFKQEDTQEEDIEKRRMFWYVIILIISASVAKMFGYTSAGIIALVGVHIVWWKYQKKGSLVTKIIVGGMLLYLILAWLLPPVVEIRNAGLSLIGKVFQDMASTTTALNDNYGKPPKPNGEVSSSSSLTGKPAVQQLYQVLHVVPGGNFQKADIPLNKVIENISWDCAQGCIVQIEHDGFPMCTTGFYQEAQCASVVVDYKGNNIARYREQFVLLPGMTVDYPKDLVRVIFSFGTDEDFGPIQVNVKTAISG